VKLRAIARVDPTPQVGDKQSIEHTFTLEEVRAFAEASGDRGVQHLVPDAQGRLMVHGLLLGTLPTIVGGRMNFLAREMRFEFLRPVFTGEPVRCEVVVTRWEPAESRTLVSAEWECLNPAQQLVMRGGATGIVRTSSASV
jgi:3-hydroxybutyryl-CoA dehydratase